MQAVGDGTGILPIYEMQMEYKGLPYLHPAPEPVMRHIMVKECCGRPPVALQRVEQVRRCGVLLLHG
jgi:chloride channel 7